jgi:hypothetical protein
MNELWPGISPLERFKVGKADFDSLRPRMSEYALKGMSLEQCYAAAKRDKERGRIRKPAAAWERAVEEAGGRAYAA